MKIIALDVGTKRIGVAKADTSVRIAVPFSAVEVNGEEFKKIASLARAWDINNFVLGMPRNSQGQETKQSVYVRAFARELKKAIPSAKICFQDESLTSVEAEKRLSSRKKGFKKGDIDSEAAAIILQDFIEEKTGKSTSVATSAKRKSVQGARPNRLMAVIIALAVLLVLAGGAAFFFYQYNLRPMADITCSDQIDADECTDIEFPVASGANLTEVSEALADAGLIRNAFVFQVHFRITSGGEPLKAGDYQFNKTMPVAKIAELLRHGSDSVYSLTILPGQTLMSIRKVLIDSGYTAEEVDQGLQADYSGKDFSWVLEGRPESATLEGYLYGDTYEFYQDDPVETVISRLISELASVVKSEDLKSKFSAHGLSLYEGITLASVVQREAMRAEDMRRVAQVFYNRLSAGMTLGSDVTAKYAADLIDPDRTTYDNNAAILDIDSPYNTRKHGGLPYGPIANPGKDALLAVASPDDSVADKLFFITGDDGAMYYASTEAEHNSNVANYCQTLCNITL